MRSKLLTAKRHFVLKSNALQRWDQAYQLVLRSTLPALTSLTQTTLTNNQGGIKDANSLIGSSFEPTSGSDPNN